MSQTIDQPSAEPSVSVPAEAVDEILPESRSGQPFAWLWMWTPRQMVVVLVFCVFFLFNNYLRLFYSDFWGHVSYGNWILDQGELPEEEPFVQWAEGMPIMCTAWGSQVLLALGGRWGGPEAYSAIFAVAITLTYLLLARVSFLQTRNIGLSVLAALLAWGVNWGRHAVIRPEMFGGLCFVILLWLVVRSDANRDRSPAGIPQSDETTTSQKLALWLGVPILFLIWANLHGSFIVGFAVLGGYALGRGIEVFWRERKIAAVLVDSRFRRFLLLTELAVLASAVNPYGFDLLLHTVLFPSNPNLADIMEWFPLEMVSVEGVTVGSSWVLLLIALRHSRARVAPSDVILLAVFTLAVCLRVRMVAWYGPVWMLVIAPHFQDLFSQWRETGVKNKLAAYENWASRRSPRICMFGLLAIWLAFVFSPSSTLVLEAKPRERSLQYHGDTPLGITDFLKEHPPEGRIFNPQWWGDWLVWEGPPGLEVMMTTNAVHVVPPKVWRDYLSISAGQAGLSSRLAKYRINTIIIHKELQPDLDRSIRQNLGWKIVYEDDLGVVAERKRISNDANPSTETADENDSPSEL